ncbi:T-cell immunoglobulin and mucin domain-containing protein 4-like [Hyperolius riggenbachi]|uniref:T-cell immunoglobulin and mucin domain-containing protein 4-like n=1 Tax=Hyperolius riggenbachi TaxID=752182 RepID=UPI0035A30CFB
MSPGSLQVRGWMPYIICLHVIYLHGQPGAAVQVTGSEGDTLTLPCNYTLYSKDPYEICWGWGSCPFSQCSGSIISTDGSRVIWRRSDRYQLLGDITQGDVSLTITNVTKEDGGIYCCRVEVPGWFNDKKREITVTINPPESVTGDSTTEVTASTQEYFRTRMSMYDLTSTDVKGRNDEETSPAQKAPPTTGEKQTDTQDGHMAAVIAGAIFLILLIILTLTMLYRWKFCKMTEDKADSILSVINLDTLVVAENQAMDNIYT